MRYATLLAMAVGLILTASTATADLVPVGDPVPGGSWFQQFNETGVGNFDLVAVRMTSAGDTFEHSTHYGFDQAGWALKYENAPMYPTLASATGPAVTSLTWTIKFAGNNNDNPLAFDFVAFYGDTLLESAHCYWPADGTPHYNDWVITAPGSWSPTRAELVPVPGAVVLGAVGIGLISWWKRR